MFNHIFPIRLNLFGDIIIARELMSALDVDLFPKGDVHTGRVVYTHTLIYTNTPIHKKHPHTHTPTKTHKHTNTQTHTHFSPTATHIFVHNVLSTSSITKKYHVHPHSTHPYSQTN